MNWFLIPPIVACLTCCMLTVAILGRGARNRASRLAAGLTLAAAF